MFSLVSFKLKKTSEQPVTVSICGQYWFIHLEKYLIEAIRIKALDQYLYYKKLILGKTNKEKTHQKHLDQKGQKISISTY